MNEVSFNASTTSNEVRQSASGHNTTILSSKINHKKSTEAIVDHYLEYQRIFLFRKRIPLEITSTPIQTDEPYSHQRAFNAYLNKHAITCMYITEQENTTHYHGIAWFPNQTLGKQKWKRINEEHVNLFIRRLREKYWINYITKNNPRRLHINDNVTMKSLKTLNLIAEKTRKNKMF